MVKTQAFAAAVAVASSATANNLFPDFECTTECITPSLAKLEVSEACIACFSKQARNVQGGAQLPAGLILDLLQALVGKGYTEMWCGAEDLPSGWHPDGNGSFTGCERTENFPGEGHTSYQSYDYVKSEMATLPGLQNSGKVWRGNELGFIISNELYWEQVTPRTVLLGATVEQHKIIRPILMDLFSKCDQSCEDWLRESVRSLFSKDKLAVQDDVKIWVHNLLMEIIFPGETSPIDPVEFVETQSAFTQLSTITQLLPDTVSNMLELITKTRTNLNTYFKQLYPLVERMVERRYGDSAKDWDCSPTRDGDCIRQLTSAMIDTLLAAGGLSVPGGISTGLWVLYGNTREANSRPASKDIFPNDYQLQHGDNKELEFYYESMRLFAPVVGFPWWTTPPARAFNERADQADGGVRKILNLALAQQDPNQWGADAHVFRPKSLDKYHSDFIGFADFAVDDSVAEGKMNRKCPGKELALKMGKVFFEEFDQTRWCTKDDSKYKGATPFMDSFTLEKDTDCTPPTEQNKVCVWGCDKGSRTKWYSLYCACDQGWTGRCCEQYDVTYAPCAVGMEPLCPKNKLIGREFSLGDILDDNQKYVGPITVGTRAHNLPINMRGVFWLKDQKSSSSIVSFASSRDGDGLSVWSDGKISVRVSGDRVWSFASKGFSYQGVELIDLVYDLTANSDTNPTHIDIIPRSENLNVGLSGVLGEFLLTFEMDLMTTNYPATGTRPAAVQWNRPSSVLGVEIKQAEYEFTQIIDEHGNPTAAFDDYIEYNTPDGETDWKDNTIYYRTA